MGDERRVADGYDVLAARHESADTPDESADRANETADTPDESIDKADGSIEDDAVGERDGSSGGTTANPWGTSAYQRTYAWPATTELLPSSLGDRVVLAGCGRGDHAAWFRDRGASVVGFDLSAEAVGIAHDRHADGGQDFDRTAFCRGSVTAPPVADAGDTIVCHLVVSHVPDLQAAFEGLRVAACGEGTLVLTTVHPAYLAEKLDDPEPAPQRFDNDWDGTTIPTYYRPVSTIRRAVDAAGWEIERVAEPTPPPAFAETHPERYEAALDRPELLCLRATCSGE